jgi:hypothetical protein
MTTTTTDDHVLVLRCDQCDKPTGPAGFIVVVDAAAARDRGIALRNWEDRHRNETGAVIYHPLDRTDPAPESVPWRVYHDDCAPADLDEMIAEYRIDTDRCVTFPHLVAWTANLMEKKWLRHTNWHGFLRGALIDSGLPAGVPK